MQQTLPQRKRSWLGRGRGGVGLDLGTGTIRMVTEQGLQVEAPSLYAIRRSTGEAVAWGEKAIGLLIREGAAVELKRVIEGGAMTESGALLAIMRDLVGGRWLKRRTLLALPAEAAPQEVALYGALLRQAGAGQVEAVPSVVAAAFGADLPVHAPAGHMLVEAGAARATAAVFSAGGMAVTRTGLFGSGDIDRALDEHLRRQHGLKAGSRVITRLKEERAGVTAGDPDETVAVRGIDQATGLPRTARVETSEVREMVWPAIRRLTDLVAETLNSTPPELAGDLLQNGICLTGGMANLPGLADLLAVQTRCPVWVAEEPERACARGLIQLLSGKAVWNDLPWSHLLQRA